MSERVVRQVAAERGWGLDVDDLRFLLTQRAYDTPEDGMVELTGVSFVADEPSIFGSVDHDYVARELAWYDSRSLSVDDIPGGAPKVWRDVSSEHGHQVNSNYGTLLYDTTNWSQYREVLAELRRDPLSRRALAIYTRPSMHVEQHRDGMQDFVCTNAVQYLIRDDRLHAVVQMRSNDAVFGYRNDYAWQSTVLDRLAADLDVVHGTITWQVGSLHVYPRHRWLVDHYRTTGEWDVPVRRTKKEEKDG